MKKKYDISIDRLKICYKTNPYLWDFLKNDSNLHFPDFKLINQEEEDEKGRERKSRTFNVVMNDGRLLGEFTINNSNLANGEYAWFEFANSALYSNESLNDLYPRSNCLVYVTVVADSLHLKFNNVTSLEIAIDTNWNVINKVRKLIHNHNEYDMFTCGNIVKDPNRTIEDYMEIYSRSRNKLSKRPTLYFKQRQENSVALKIYDKSRELEEKGNYKEYIRDWLNFESNDIFRLEIKLRKDDFKHFAKQEWCDIRWNDLSEVLGALIHDNKYVSALWIFNARRLLYFRNKETKEYIYLEDLL